MSDEPGFGPERYSTVEAHELLGFDAGYAQAIKDVVEALRTYGMSRMFLGTEAIIFIESRFSVPSPGPEGGEWDDG